MHGRMLCLWQQSSSSGHTLGQFQCRAKGSTQAIGLLTLISALSKVQLLHHSYRKCNIVRTEDHIDASSAKLDQRDQRGACAFLYRMEVSRFAGHVLLLDLSPHRLEGLR